MLGAFLYSQILRQMFPKVTVPLQRCIETNGITPKSDSDFTAL